MRLKRIVIIGGLLVTFASLFQNCAPGNLVSQEASSIETWKTSIEGGVDPGVDPDSTETIMPVGSCIAKGLKAHETESISYRKCDGQVNQIERVMASRCCSGSATIFDTDVVQDFVCADGKFSGTAICN